MGRVVTNPTGSVVDASEVKILYESNENTNAYTDGDKASLGEVKDAIDMAKKVIEITFLLNDWTSNSDGTYSQTVNNSEIKSSMNPDLISMLSSGATPEEQKTYMKNFSILCQGVGNTANGSVTYKIYKQMTGDITVGLTRLGGVKQIESGAKVDDVKVGGVSVVKDKVAEIPAIPSADDFIPYSGAKKDIDIGDHSIILSTTGKMGELTASGTFNIGKNVSGSGDGVPGIEIDTDAQATNPYLKDSFNLSLLPTGLSISADHEDDTDGDSTDFRVDSTGLSIRKGYDTEVKITADKVTGLALPTADTDAASKKYVDDKIQRTYGYRKQLGLSDEIGSGKALTIAVELSRFSSKTGIAPDEILSFDVYANASATGMVSSIPTLGIKATTQYFTVNSKGIYTTTKWFVLTNNDPDEISYSANNAYVAIRTLYPDVTISIKKKALSS
ncbi:Uncharacterised protein [uncultured Clostridium sp.]|nr:Uncharacterised protein [uncultured Clostridium sp.]